LRAALSDEDGLVIAVAAPAPAPGDAS
jgi:hypothetical protein